MRTAAATLQTFNGCALVISRYPTFRYNAAGGGAVGVAEPLGDGRQALRFPADQVQIPPLNSRTGRILGLPLPPGLQITIEPEQLHGSVDPSTGDLELRFRARFRLQLSIGATLIYSAPALLVDTQLSTGPVHSNRHQISGQSLRPDTPGRLVGVALVPCSGAAWLDRFLGLPDEALAVLECELLIQA